MVDTVSPFKDLRINLEEREGCLLTEKRRLIELSESLRGAPMHGFPPPQKFQQFPPIPQVPMQFPMGPFNAPQYPVVPQGNPMRGTNGPCFICNQLGHAVLEEQGIVAEAILAESSVEKRKTNKNTAL